VASVRRPAWDSLLLLCPLSNRPIANFLAIVKVVHPYDLNGSDVDEYEVFGSAEQEPRMRFSPD
jgi:hypothetical protein